MRKKNCKGRCEKRVLSKCIGICRTYDALQYAYADILEKKEEIKEFQCNVPLNTEEYTTDFFCEKENGDAMVRECVLRKHLTKPMTVKQLDISRKYWLRHGVSDWGLVIEEELEFVTRTEELSATEKNNARKINLSRKCVAIRIRRK